VIDKVLLLGTFLPALSYAKGEIGEVADRGELTVLLAQLSRNYSAGANQWELEKCKWFADALVGRVRKS